METGLKRQEERKLYTRTTVCVITNVTRDCHPRCLSTTSRSNTNYTFFFSFIHFLFSCGLSTHNKHDDDDGDGNFTAIFKFQIFTPKRATISDVNFEHQLLLKLNNKFRR